jgi:hypothetical protein
MTEAAWASFANLAVLSISAIIAAGAHVLLQRIRPAMTIYTAVLAGAVAGLIALGLISSAALSLGFKVLDGVPANVVAYFCFCYVYFQFNQMGETARRVRLLCELNAAAQPLTYQEILSRYGAREVLDRRIGRLISARQIRCVDGICTVADRSVYVMARVIQIAHWILFRRTRVFRLEDQ